MPVRIQVDTVHTLADVSLTASKNRQSISEQTAVRIAQTGASLLGA